MMPMVEELYPHVPVESDHPIAHLMDPMEKGSLIALQDQRHQGAQIDLDLPGRDHRCRGRHRPSKPRQEIRQLFVRNSGRPLCGDSFEVEQARAVEASNRV